MGVSERIDTIINRTELNLTNIYHKLLMVRHYLACYLLFVAQSTATVRPGYTILSPCGMRLSMYSCNISGDPYSWGTLHHHHHHQQQQHIRAKRTSSHSEVESD